MQLLYITDETVWDEAIRGLPKHHILQSWAWGDFKARWGWQPTRLLWQNDAEPIAAAQLLRRTIPYSPFGIGYVAKGPLFDPSDAGVVTRVLHDLEAEARRQRCLFVKIDPDYRASERELLALLKRRGWEAGEPIQFPNTGTIALDADEETLMMNMKSKTRYNIRLAARRGIEVRAGTLDELPLFYDMYAETAERDGFLIRPRAYYLDLWNDFHSRGLAHLLIAWAEDTPVAGIMLFHFGERVWYFYGASTELHRRDMPTYALQWEAIRWAQSIGAAEYDLWGAPTDMDDPDDEMAGVWRFKEGFDAQFRTQIGAWDFPVFGPAYQLYTRGIPQVACNGALAMGTMTTICLAPSTVAGPCSAA